MPQLTLYHLTPTSAFHLSLRGVGQEKTEIYLPSDSLFAALVATYMETGGQPEHLTQAFPQYAEPKAAEAGPHPAPPPFLLTSTFPLAGELRFYPAPPSLNLMLSAAKREELEAKGRLKEVKKIQFLSEGLFEKLVQGEKLDTWLPGQEPGLQPGVSAAEQGLFLHAGVLWLMTDEIKLLPQAMRQDDKGRSRPLEALRQLTIWQVGTTPRVTVDRRSNASEIFYTGRVTFSPECGWWFGLAWAPEAAEATRQAVSLTLQVLPDAGLGAERAAGYGQFACRQAGERSWPTPAANDTFLTLSRYHPRQNELPQVIQGVTAAYKLVSVGGWLASVSQKAQRRRRLWLLGEGSVVQAVGAGPWGDMVDVRPIYPGTSERFDHAVWRFGLACPVKLKGDVG
jgi:CRISPR-associated protein Csm4